MFTFTDTFGVQPCLILAHPEPRYAAATDRAFRHLGWDVYPARSGLEVRRLASLLQAQLVVLGEPLPDESSFLTCAKLIQDQPHLKVVLICSQSTSRTHDLAAFVGAAALCSDREGADLLRQLASDLVPAGA